MFGRILLCCMAIWAATISQAEVRGLVIGVSDYTYIDADLKGPANDVGLVASTLLARGAKPENIRVLAAPDVLLPKNVVVSATPTRDAILDGFATLAKTAQSGDTVFVFFSGHGSQAPDQNGDEAGGFDEILLAADTKGWSGGTGLVEGAIVDDELSTRIQAILNTGAQVIAVLDSCHSATGFRDVSPFASAARYVDPATLGIPSVGGGNPTQSPTALVGDFAFLYSAQSDERAFESPLGDANNPTNWYGDFTQNLMAALNNGQGMTWAQALEATMSGLQSKGAARQTPDGEGPLLNVPVFGSLQDDGFFSFSNGYISAGALHGITIGAVFTLYDLTDQTNPIAQATITDVSAVKSHFDAGRNMPKNGVAKLLHAGPMEPFRVGLSANAPHWNEVLDQILAAQDGLVFDSTSPDLMLVPEADGLALAYPNGTLDALGAGSSFRVTEAKALPGAIERLATTHRLSQSLHQSAKTGELSFALPGSEIQIRMEKVTAAGDCETDALPKPAEKPAKVAHCDQLWLEVYNPSSTAQDVTVLYINRDFTISAIWPIGDISNRIASDERQMIGMQIQNEPNTAGFEEILVLSVPAKTGERRTDLSGLATDISSRDWATNTALSWLYDAMDGQQSTRAMNNETPKITTKRIPIRLKKQKG